MKKIELNPKWKQEAHEVAQALAELSKEYERAANEPIINQLKIFGKW